MAAARLPAWFVPARYAVTLDLCAEESEARRFQGELELEADILSAPECPIVSLHAKDLTIFSCSLSQDQDVEQEVNDCVSILINREDATVQFGFRRALKVGPCKLRISYAGSHDARLSGFYVSYSKNGLPVRSTQFEPIDARRCLPCVDEPAAKAVFQATLVVDEHLTALSNMPEAEVTVLPAAKPGLKRKKRVLFLPSPKMSSYLLAFAVAEFEFLQARTEHGVLVRVFTPPAASHQGVFALDVAVRTLNLFDNYFGVPFPLPKLDLVAVPEIAFVAMENWGMATFGESELLLDESSASVTHRMRVCGIVAHELAHQWFGNLVTMSWWDGLWLNEGFATWAQTFASDRLFPHWDAWSQFVVTDQAAALDLDALLSSHPVQVPIGRAEEVEEVFDAISYHKGACVVQLAHAFLGPEVFQRGLQLYMRQHAYGNTETHHLWQAWEQVAGAGKSVAQVMRSWTEVMGFPVLTVGKVAVGVGKVTFNVKQEWFLADGTRPGNEEGSSGANSWNVPILAECGLDGGVGNVVRETVGVLRGMKSVEFTVLFGGLTPGSSIWVKLNAGQTVPMRVVYHTEDFDILVRNFASLAAPDRAGLVLDSLALARSGRLDPSAILWVLSACRDDESAAVWEAAEAVLNKLGMLLEESNGTLGLHGFVRALISKHADALNWLVRANVNKSSLDLMMRIRVVIVRLQARFLGAEVAERCAALAESILQAGAKGDCPVPDDVVAPILRASLLHSGAVAEKLDDFLALASSVESAVVREALCVSVGSAPKSAQKLRVLEWALSSSCSAQNLALVLGGVRGSGKDGAAQCFAFACHRLPDIQLKLRGAFAHVLIGVIGACCEGFASHERANEIASAFGDLVEAQRKVRQVVEATRVDAEFLRRILESQGFARELVVVVR